MLEFILIYAALGWMASAMADAYCQEKHPNFKIVYWRSIPCWPIFIVLIIYYAVIKVIEWGIDD